MLKFNEKIMLFLLAVMVVVMSPFYYDIYQDFQEINKPKAYSRVIGSGVKRLTVESVESRDYLEDYKVFKFKFEEVPQYLYLVTVRMLLNEDRMSEILQAKEGDVVSFCFLHGLDSEIEVSEFDVRRVKKYKLHGDYDFLFDKELPLSEVFNDFLPDVKGWSFFDAKTLEQLFVKS